MAWTDFGRGLGDIVPSPRESERFGYSIARLSVGTGWKTTAATAEQLGRQLWSRVEADASDIVIVRFPSELAQLPAAGTVLPGWTVIPAGNIVYWSYDAEKSAVPPLPDDGQVIVHKASSGPSANPDVIAFDASPFLGALDDSFSNYTSHYSANPLLNSSLITAGYREWAESTIRDPQGQVYGFVDDKRIIGVAVSRTLNVADGAREIELAGMVSDAQGRGRYRNLLNAVARDAHDDGIRTIFISTQGYNIRAQRAWASAGYKPEQSIDTLHVVRSSLLMRKAD